LKFKLVFILFTGVILVFLGFVLLIPFLLFDPSAAGLFWKTNWPFILLLTLVLGGVDGFYFSNRRLFGLLEREDWPALVTYLEDRVISRDRYQPHLVRLLANTYLLLSDSPAVLRLENRLAAAKPALLEANALIFGAARILGRDPGGAVRFFGDRLDAIKAPDRNRREPWLRWYYGFSLLLDRQFSPAADQFIITAFNAGEPVLIGLAAYFLGDNLARALAERRREFQEASLAGRERLKKALPRPEQWRRAGERVRTEIHGAVLARYLDEAGQWLYAKEETHEIF
jgi:hypothetical protein